MYTNQQIRDHICEYVHIMDIYGVNTKKSSITNPMNFSIGFYFSAPEVFQNMYYVRPFLSWDIPVNIHSLQIGIHPTDLKRHGQLVATTTLSKKMPKYLSSAAILH